MTNELKKSVVIAFEAIKQQKPLIHHITNYVVMNQTANATLHLGASPVMAHATEEVEQMINICQALVLNPGTLSEHWIKAMLLAGHAANKKGIPIVFDPVGMGATEFRTLTFEQLTNSLQLQIIKGNSGEIGRLHGDHTVDVRGVDSVTGVVDPAATVRDLAAKFNGHTVVALSGKTDYVSDGQRIVGVANGSERLSLLTGMGCTVTALMGCFAAVTKDYLVAAIGGFAVMGVCAELADKQTRDKGPASFQVALFDQFAMLTSDELEQHMNINIIA
jgi:hydroxyethylthiazole kinase